jgi:hypothetical protein
VRRVGGVTPSVLLALCGFHAAGAARGQEESPAVPACAFAERGMHILHLPLLDFGAAQPSAPAAGALEWTLTSAYATTYSTTWHARRYHADPARQGTPLSQEEADNIHAVYPQDRVLFADGEALRTSLAARYGITPSLSVTVEVPYIVRGLTALESFVSKFHKALGVDENGRDEFPMGRFTVMLQSPGGPMSLTGFEPGSGVGDVTATLSWRRPRSSGGWTFGADLAVKAPTGSAANANGSGGWDGGLLAFALWEKGRWTLEADGSVVVPGKWKVPVPLAPTAVGRVLASAVYGFSAKTRAGLSVTAAQSPFRDKPYSSLSKAGVEGGLGVEHDFGPRLTARLMLTEQLPSAGDRADFGVVLGLRYR